VKTDPEVPPLPPHVTLAEAKAFMSSLAKGDQSVGRVLANTARQLFGGSKS
jgi:pyruvate dehydrogenase (quinone)